MVLILLYHRLFPSVTSPVRVTKTTVTITGNIWSTNKDKRLARDDVYVVLCLSD